LHYAAKLFLAIISIISRIPRSAQIGGKPLGMVPSIAMDFDGLAGSAWRAGKSANADKPHYLQRDVCLRPALAAAIVLKNRVLLSHDLRRSLE
jgi:hypothetical protein